MNQSVISPIATLFYLHDPMCAWCWGYKPTFEKLLAKLPANIALEYLAGGLAPDSDEPMPDDLLEVIPNYWRRIQSLLGTEFNFDFWTQCQPRRSTYPACRSVLSAKQQGKEAEMITAIQKAYYLRAMNPSDHDTHYLLAEELGLHVEKFKDDYTSAQIEALFQQQMQLAHSMPMRGFPSLVLALDKEYYGIPVDYKDEQVSLEFMQRYVSC